MKNTFLFSTLILFTGCSWIFSVHRDADKIEDLSPSCIEKILKQIDGLSDVHITRKVRQSTTQTDITQYSYCYKFQKLPNCISTIQDHTGLSSYSHGYFASNDFSSQEKVDILLPKIRSIDETIATSCNLPNLQKIKEKCIGVDCS